MSGFILPEWTSSPLLLVGFVILIYGLLRVSRAIDSRTGPPISRIALEQYAKTHAAAGKERRRFPRREGHAVTVEIQTNGDGSAISGRVLDFSQGGLGLLADEAVTVGNYVKVRAVAAAPTDWIAAEVRHCERRGEGWKLGCMFLEKVSWNRMKQFSV